MEKINENGMSGDIFIEALFAPGCDSRKATLLMIHAATRDQPVTIDLKETTIRSIQEAEREKFLGSPSVRINGKDIEQEPMEKANYGIG